MKLNKVKVLRILFKLSFLPYILLLLSAIYNSIFGCTVFFTTYYGLEAFYDTIVLVGFAYFPIFSVVLVYEIFYLIWINVKKNK